jgi:hypothetical protein
MSVISTSLRVGINAVSAGAAKYRMQKQKAELNEAGRRDGAPPARGAKRADTYEAGAAAYAGKTRRAPAPAPDLQRYAATADSRRGGNSSAGEGRAARARSRVARVSIDVRG